MRGRRGTKEDMRNNGFVDVYVYIYAETEEELLLRRNEAHRYCVEHRYIPEYKTDIGEKEELERIIYDKVLEKEKSKFIVYRHEDLGEDWLNILFTIGLRGYEIEGIDGYRLPDEIEYLIEAQRELYRKRIVYGRMRKVNAGGWISRPPYGYKRKGDSLVLDSYESFIVRFAFYRRSQGCSLQGIAHELRLRGFKNRNGRQFSKMTIKNILDNADFYKGKIIFCGEVHDGKHPRLLKEDGTVDMEYINNHFDTEKEKEIIRANSEKLPPEMITPYIKVKKRPYGNNRRV